MACIFCHIIAGRAPAHIVYRDEQAIVFHDIRPAAPVHLLIAPIRHIASLNELEEGDGALLAHMLLLAPRLAEQQGIRGAGYRLVINTGVGGGQTIPHLHFHLLGGRSFSAQMTGRMAD